MSTIHEILCKLTFLGDHFTPPSAHGLVKAYTRFHDEWDALNIKTTFKTKGVDEPCLCHLEAVILGLLKTPARYDASEPKASMKGLGVDEDSLTEIICSSTNQELQEINRVYEEMYRTENGSAVDYELLDQDTCYLHDAGVKRKGTNVPKCIGIMIEWSMCHFLKVFESIKKEVKGDLEDVFLNLVQCIQNKPLYFADRLRPREWQGHFDMDMLKIRSDFKSNAKGDYQKALLYPRGGD
ncbi:hypothetical protein FD754_008366 [Muntiacus muntjak]|uniref:Annexin A2 n=1 Tax=Muntiacus muntjak TaxID=9888 RepID=A0A5N3WQZ3_MUNMU|nr:hypothetical protein FD754_008366 [Muntiacus muntjak]